MPRSTVLLRLALLLAVLPFLLLTIYSQPFLDDYRNVVRVLDGGFMAAQRWAYFEWTGRYVTTWLLMVANPLAHGWLWGVKVVVAALLLAQVATLAALLRAWANVMVPVRPWPWARAISVSALAWTLVMNGLPAPFSWLYWYSGAVVYQVPLLGLLLFGNGALRVGWSITGGKRRTAWGVAAAAGLVVAVAGNELALLQAGAALVAVSWRLPRRARGWWWTWALVALAAAVPAVMAPGNFVRQQLTASPAGPWGGLLFGPRVLKSVGQFLGDPACAATWVAATGLGIWLGLRYPAPARRRWPLRQWLTIGAGVVGFQLLGFVFFRLVWTEPPRIRAQNELLAAGALVLLGTGWAVAARQPTTFGNGPTAWLYNRPALLISVLACFFAAGHVGNAWHELLTTAPAYEAQWQARYTVLRGAGPAATVRLPPLRLAHPRVLAPLANRGYPLDFDVDIPLGCDGTINTGMARYFGVRSVCREAGEQ